MKESDVRIDHCMPRPPAALVVTRHDSARTRPGLTLCHSSGSRSAWLIDLAGNERHRWQLDRGPRWHEAQLLDNDPPYFVARVGHAAEHRAVQGIS